MLNYPLGDLAMQVAKVSDMGGRVAADKIGSGSRAGRRNEPLRRLARYSLLGTALALLPMTQAVSSFGAQFVPLQVSTVPANGDTNPYGVAFVPFGFLPGGPLNPGDILVSNFNNSAGQSGTGTTIVRVTPGGQQTLFFNGNPTNQLPPTLGLTTALGVLRGGFVLVGNLPTADGTSTTIQKPGSLLVINRFGQQIATISDPVLLDGPWDLTILDGGGWAKVFVSNVLSGTVTRLDLDVDANNVSVKKKVQIASGYKTRTDPVALVLGPTGLAFDPVTGILYVASTFDNEIFAIANAAFASPQSGTGKVVSTDNHLRGPLGLAFTPNGHLITTNGDAENPSATPSQNSEIVELTKDGNFVAQFSIDSAVGAAFGIAVGPLPMVPLPVVLARLAAVDDARNDLTVHKLSPLSTP